MKEYSETHQRGDIEVNTDPLGLPGTMCLRNSDFGIQIAKDGRIWICIDGIAFIRFKPPLISQKMKGGV